MKTIVNLYYEFFCLPCKNSGLLFDQRADDLALQGLGNVGGLAQVEDQDRQAVVAAEGGGGGVHDSQALIQHAGEVSVS